MALRKNLRLSTTENRGMGLQQPVIQPGAIGAADKSVEFDPARPPEQEDQLMKMIMKQLRAKRLDYGT